MKKDLKSKSKRKWIVGGVLLFGGVALLTTGFATWAIGVNQTKQNLGTNVTVEGTVNESVKLTVTPVNMAVSVSENHPHVDGEIFYTKDEVATDFKVIVNIKLEIGADYYANNLSSINKIQFSFIDSWEGLTKPENYESSTDKTAARKVNVPDPGNGKTHKSGDYEYITIPTSSSLAIPALKEDHSSIADGALNPVNFTYTGSKTGSKVFTVENLEITLFDWGDYFDSMSPCTYYNKLYNNSGYQTEKGLRITDSAEDIDIVYNEMNKMKADMQPERTTSIIYVSAALV
ncbi:MAG: hypothetical protein SOY58_00645 [Candidatus Onthovivens sp.]|nr:hypothetical protein [Candidatus Onthovivens sp.]